MANNRGMTICAFEDIEQSGQCYENMFGCTMKTRQAGPCATLECSDAELYVCPRTTIDEGLSESCKGFQGEEAWACW